MEDELSIQVQCPRGHFLMNIRVHHGPDFTLVAEGPTQGHRQVVQRGDYEFTAAAGRGGDRTAALNAPVTVFTCSSGKCLNKTGARPGARPITVSRARLREQVQRVLELGVSTMRLQD